jgi:hypothetical protein
MTPCLHALFKLGTNLTDTSATVLITRPFKYSQAHNYKSGIVGYHYIRQLNIVCDIPARIQQRFAKWLQKKLDHGLPYYNIRKCKVCRAGEEMFENVDEDEGTKSVILGKTDD